MTYYKKHQQPKDYSKKRVQALFKTKNKKTEQDSMFI